MSPERSKRLCENFAELSGEHFAFCFGDGRVELLYTLSRALADHAKRADLQLVVTDIKEKHGSLRCYAEGTDEEADRLIDAAEYASLAIQESER